MKAAIYYGPKDIRIEERPYPAAGEDDVVVKVVKAGICGSDITAYLHSGMYVGISENSEFGHEMVGIIDTVGANVKDAAVGDRVFVNPATCKKEGVVKTPVAGAFSQYVRVENAKYGYNIYKIPDDVTFDEVVISEPLGVGTRGKNIVNAKAGENIVVLGAGTIGLCCLASLVAKGCVPVVVDINEERLSLVKEIGGTAFNNANGGLNEYLMEHFGTAYSSIGQPVGNVDAYIDCAGATKLVNDIVGAMKPGARLSIVAMHKQPLEINSGALVGGEIMIKGSCCYQSDDIDEVLDNVFNKKTKIAKIITHHFSYDHLIEAFETASDPKTGAIKVVIDY